MIAAAGRTSVPLLLLCLALPGTLGAQATPYLPLGDPAYADLARLSAFGLLDGVLFGQRPWSVSQARTLAEEARRNLGRLRGEPSLQATATRALDAVDSRLGPPSKATALPFEGRLDATWTNSRFRDVGDNGVSASSARLNPLLAYDLGRRTVRGVTAGLEAVGRASLHGRLVGEMGVRLQAARSGSSTDDTREVTATTAHLRGVFGNVAVTVGRAPLLWGQGPDGGLLLSSNTRAPLLISISNEAPARLPWVFGRLGSGRFQLTVADLGTEGRTFPHVLLTNLRSSFRPAPGAEFGVGILVQQGGEGAPGATLLERVADVLVVPDLFITDRDFLFSNKMILLDGRIRIGGRLGMEVWGELALDDFDHRRLTSIVRHDAGYLAGVRLARLDEAGRLGLTLEATRTGLRFYGHYAFQGGVTLERRIMGSELGPDAQGLRARLDWVPPGRHRFGLEAASERRSGDRWTLVLDDPPNGFVRTAEHPDEVRFRLLGFWRWSAHAAGPWWLAARVGWERVENLGSTRGPPRHQGLLRLVLGRDAR